jgi:hypothetical protein
MRTLRSIANPGLRINLIIPVVLPSRYAPHASPRFLWIQPTEKRGKYRLEHRRGQFSGIGVETRAMVAVG